MAAYSIRRRLLALALRDYPKTKMVPALGLRWSALRKRRSGFPTAIDR